MIIQCDQCKAKFKLDPAKVTEAGVKVRCSKCKHVFVVRKEAPAEEQDFDTMLGGLQGEQAAPPPTEEPAPQPPVVSAAQPPAPQVEQEEPAFDYQAFQASVAKDAEEDTAPPSIEWDEPTEDYRKTEDDLAAFGEESPDFSEEADSTPVAPGSGPKVIDFSHLDFGPDEPAFAPPKAEEGPELGDFNFDEPAAPESPSPSFAAEEENTAGFDEFSFDDTPAASAAPSVESDVTAEEGQDEGFGDFTFQEPALPPDLPAESDSNLEFGDLEENKPEQSAPLTFEIEEEPPAPSPVESTAGSAPADGPDDFDFGAPPVAESQTPPAAGDDLKASAEPQWAFEDERSAAGGITPPLVADEDELPPLSISSRRKGNSTLPIVVTGVAVILILGLVALGVYFLKAGPDAFNRLGLSKVAGMMGIATEEGSIAVRNIQASYVTSKEAGELFVIRGEAVNNYLKPRASIQVKAALYGPAGAAGQKTAYCGNPLSPEQLAILPPAKIEATMANQFGQSLSNLGVKPKQPIPFMIVFINPPKEAREFGVEVAGSTVASQ